MRYTALAALPAAMIFAVTPAAAQVSAHLRVDIPIGRPAVRRAVPHRELIIRGYDARLFGDWENYYDLWTPVTVYLYGGRYYDYPIVEWAQPVVVYRYRDQIFFPPADRRFEVWRRDVRAPAPVVRARPRPVESRGDFREAPAFRNDRGVRAPERRDAGRGPGRVDGRRGGRGH